MYFWTIRCGNCTSGARANTFLEACRICGFNVYKSQVIKVSR